MQTSNSASGTVGTGHGDATQASNVASVAQKPGKLHVQAGGTWQWGQCSGSSTASLAPEDGVSAIRSLGVSLKFKIGSYAEKFSTSARFIFPASRLMAWLNPRIAKSASPRERDEFICFFICCHCMLL